MNHQLQSGLACVLALGVTSVGLASWVNTAEPSPATPATEAEAELTEFDFIHGWYVLPEAISSNGVFRARTLPDIPEANQPVEVQVHIASHLKVSGMRLFVRTRSIDAYGQTTTAEPSSAWHELCATSSRPPTDKSRRTPGVGTTLHTRSPLFGTEVFLSQQLQLSPGPHEFEFRLVPTSEAHWLAQAKSFTGWSVWVE